MYFQINTHECFSVLHLLHQCKYKLMKSCKRALKPRLKVRYKSLYSHFDILEFPFVIPALSRDPRHALRTLFQASGKAFEPRRSVSVFLNKATIKPRGGSRLKAGMTGLFCLVYSLLKLSLTLCKYKLTVSYDLRTCFNRFGRPNPAAYF